MKMYVSKIQDLEGELLHLQSLTASKESKHGEFVIDCHEVNDDELCSKNAYSTNLDELSSVETKDIDVNGKVL